MKMKILIAYDGSDCARDAIEGLRLAGLPDEAEAVVISIADVWLTPPSSYEVVESAFEQQLRARSEETGERARLAVEKARDLANDATNLVLTVFPAWEARAGSPAWEIIQKADEWEPDLIVVGSHGRTALGRFFLGSVSQRVVTEARSSVRVACRSIKRLAVSSTIKSADPKRLIVEEAESWGADSIFLGARGLRRIERFLIGSVSAAVAARAHCSVEIVRGYGRKEV